MMKCRNLLIALFYSFRWLQHWRRGGGSDSGGHHAAVQVPLANVDRHAQYFCRISNYNGDNCVVHASSWWALSSGAVAVQQINNLSKAVGGNSRAANSKSTSIHSNRTSIKERSSYFSPRTPSSTYTRPYPHCPLLLSLLFASIVIWALNEQIGWIDGFCDSSLFIPLSHALTSSFLKSSFYTKRNKKAHKKCLTNKSYAVTITHTKHTSMLIPYPSF